ncbi:MAG: trigger factor, partial [Bdellovibrionota bacterium]
MELMVSVEKASPIVRKLTVKVPAKEVATRFERGLAEVQKTAKLKGFRPGQVPISIVKQYYGEDVKHRVFHTVIDESYEQAVRDQKLKAVGRPKIDTPDHQKGKGDHDHGIDEGQDLTYVATVEVLPELEVKGYTGVALSKDKVEVTDEDVEKVVENLRGSQAELVPVGSGLVGADGKSTSRPAKKGDHVDVQFDGGLVTDQGVERKEGMKGQRVIEIGSDSLIPGFEDNLVGMRSGDTKTFRLNFPKDYFEADMAGKESEFTVTLNEVKE